jgi:DNA-binding transcriptional regulator YiaG
MARKYQSELLGVLHQDALADYQLGIISDEEMREYDEDCLVSEPKIPRKTQTGIRQAPASAHAGPRPADN